MISLLLFVVLFAGLATTAVSNSLVLKCLGVKVAGDSLAAIILGFSGSLDSGDLRFVSLSVLSLTTGFVFLMVIVGRRKFKNVRDSL